MNTLFSRLTLIGTMNLWTSTLFYDRLHGRDRYPDAVQEGLHVFAEPIADDEMRRMVLQSKNREVCKEVAQFSHWKTKSPFQLPRPRTRAPFAFWRFPMERCGWWWTPSFVSSTPAGHCFLDLWSCMLWPLVIWFLAVFCLCRLFGASEVAEHFVRPSSAFASSQRVDTVADPNLENAVEDARTLCVVYN